MSRDPLLDRAIDDEIRHHLAERVDALIAEGMTAGEARREARRRFGDLGRWRRELERAGCPDAPRTQLLEWIASVLQDLRGGVRIVGQAPGFALSMILTIALGVGANVAVYSVTDAVLLRPLPYESPGDLVSLLPFEAAEGRVAQWMSAEQAFAWQRAASSTVAMMLSARVNFVGTDGLDPIEVPALAVSTNWLDTLGVQPILGRGFLAEESRPGQQVAILSHQFWRSEMASDPDVVGRVLTLDGLAYDVIGVMGPRFRFTPRQRTDAWVPLTTDAIAGVDKLQRIEVIARIPPGQDAASLLARLEVIGEGLQASEPRAGGWLLRTRPLDYFRANPDVQRALWIMTASVAVMLLIAVINAVNLLLARGIARHADAVVRGALGASRARLIRQQITENLVLMIAGGAAAILLARFLVAAIANRLPDDITFFLVGEVGLDVRVLAFALVATAFVALAVGSLPAWIGSRGARAGGTRWTSAGRPALRLRAVLVVAEVALSVALLVAAGLMVRSFTRLTSVDPGYDPANLLQVSLELPGFSYPDRESRAVFFNELRAQLALIPGVASASLANGVPPRSGYRSGITPQAEGQEPKQFPQLLLPSATIDPEFFPTLGVEIVAGRNFTLEDGRLGDRVIIDRELARFLFGANNPVGRRFRVDSSRDEWLEVVGVIEDLKLMGQDDRLGTMSFFRAVSPDRGWGFMSVVMRTVVPPELVEAEVREAVRRIDPALPISELISGDHALAESVDKPRFLLRMMGSFAMIAIALAAIGTYGVLVFSVRQRAREFGIRVALGARGSDVRAMVLKQGMSLTLAGLGLGLIGAMAAARMIGALLFEVEPTDPATLAGVAALMIAVAVAACWGPARRATRVDPVEVLRAE